jgi:uncharacterized DUF497 family protein
VVFIERESATRVISLRKATKPEATLYARS